MSRRSSRMSLSVTVAVPARLHLGFLDLHGGLGRRFGGIGLSVDGPRTRLTIRPAARTRIDGPDGERVRRHVETMQRVIGGAGYDVRIDQAVPPHIGLGSGTLLALALAAGLRRVVGLPLDPCGDAVRLGRGARSGVGIGLVDGGGLAVDGGRGPATAVAPLIARLPFPEHWRVLLVLDRARQGLHGEAELGAFAALPPFSDTLAAHLCRLVLMQALPAVVENDISGFGAAIAEIQVRLGDYFAPAQGGQRFASPDVAGTVADLARAGAHGIGQSSWGPTGFAFAASTAEAERLAAAARRRTVGSAIEIHVCRGLNHGAEITEIAAAHAAE